MAALRCLSDVRVEAITAGLCRILTALEQVCRLGTHPDVPDPVQITAISNGQHMTGSRHYRGEAVDIRSKSFQSADAKRWFCDELAAALGPRFTVLLESAGQANEHVHVQVRKGTAYP